MRAGKKTVILLLVLALLATTVHAATILTPPTFAQGVSMTEGNVLCKIDVLNIQSTFLHSSIYLRADDCIQASNQDPLVRVSSMTVKSGLASEHGIVPSRGYPYLKYVGGITQDGKNKYFVSGVANVLIPTPDTTRTDDSIILQHTGLCANKISATFNQYTGIPDFSTGYLMERADNDDPDDNCEPVTGRRQGIVNYLSDMYKLDTVFCDALSVTIIDTTDPWQKSVKGNTYQLIQQSTGELLWQHGASGSSMIFTADWDPSSKEVSEIRVDLNDDGTQGSAGVEYQINCINPPGPEENEAVCEATYGLEAWHEDLAITPGLGKCCMPDTLGSTTFSDGVTWYCEQLVSPEEITYRWSDEIIEDCTADGKEGERLRDDPLTYCCVKDSEWYYQPHLYSDDQEAFVPDVLSAKDYYCKSISDKGKLEPEDVYPDDVPRYWAFFTDADGEKIWHYCDEDYDDALSKDARFQCAPSTKSGDPGTWITCQCTETNSINCGPLTPPTGYKAPTSPYYCAYDNTWTTDPNAAGACPESITFTDSSGNDKCCLPGVFAAGTTSEQQLLDEGSFDQIYTAVCYDGTLIKENNRPPTMIEDVFAWRLS